MNRTGWYYVEGWSGMDCRGFANVRAATTAMRRADTFVLDHGCDRVYIRQADGIVATYQATGGWRTTDKAPAALAALLAER
jgi:hypothetical protein